MKSILLNKELLLPMTTHQAMTTHQVNEIEQENNDNLKLALGKLIVEIDFSLGKLIVEIDFSLGTIEVRNKENRVCVNTYENEIVSIDLEEIND